MLAMKTYICYVRIGLGDPSIELNVKSLGTFSLKSLQ